tara:strand:+ start:143 stop:259 length:117 start_codon:yes stop_codon:yes gene_type:complete
MKNIKATALHENANGKKANNAIPCIRIKWVRAIGLNWS